MEKSINAKRNCGTMTLSKISTTLNTTSSSNNLTDRSSSGNFQGGNHCCMDLSPIKLKSETSQTARGFIDDCLQVEELFNQKPPLQSRSQIRANLQKICMYSRGSSHFEEEKEARELSEIGFPEENFLNISRRRLFRGSNKGKKENKESKLIATPIKQFQETVYKGLLEARFPFDSFDDEVPSEHIASENKENLGCLRNVRNVRENKKPNSEQKGGGANNSARKVPQISSGAKLKYDSSSKKGPSTPCLPPMTPSEKSLLEQFPFHSEIKDCRTRLQYKINIGYSNRISYEREKIPHLRGKLGSDIRKSFRTLFKDM